jgi:purine nucleoside phosphorylase
MEFLLRLGESEKFVFLPKTPETLSRIAVEARMMGLSVITNNMVGATKEDWFSLKGEELIEVIKNKRIEIPNIVTELLK